MLFGTLALRSEAQVTAGISSLIGIPPHARTLPVRFGQINLDSGDMHLEIPLRSTQERGLAPNSVTLVYDSMFWNSTGVFGTFNTNTALFPTGTGWSIVLGDSNGALGAYPVGSSNIACSRRGDQGGITKTSWYAGVDAHNTLHTFSFLTSPIIYNNCTYANSTTPDPSAGPASRGGTAYAQDGTGYRLTIASDGITASVQGPNGVSGYNGSNYSTFYGSETPNGNVYGLLSGDDELGGQPPTTSASCSTTYGLPITTVSQVSSYQPYTAKTPVTCTWTFPAWDGVANVATTAQYVLVYEYIPVCTKLFSDNVNNNEYCGGMWVMESVILPGGMGSYEFGYDTGTSGTHLGELTSITLPTGEVIEYGYGYPSQTVANDTPFVTSVTDLGGTTAISYGGNQSNPYPETITFPAHPATAGGTKMIQDQRTISASANYGNGGPLAFTITDYSGGTPIQTTVENRDTTANARVTSVSSTWSATGESHTVSFKYADDPSVSGYQSYGGVPINMISQESDYDSGTLVRTLTTQYMRDTPANAYVSAYNMINYPISQTLTDGSGNTAAQTLYTYDEYSASYCQSSYPSGLSGIAMLTAVTGASGHDDSRGTSYTARGNVTTMQQLASAGAYVATHKCYDTLGNVTRSIDGNSQATRYSYKDNYLDTACIPSGTNTYAFPTSVTNPMGQQTAIAYYTCNRAAGQVQTANDLANSRTGTTITYDVVGRPHCTTAADNSQTCTTYLNSNEVETTSALNDATTTILDEYGRATNQVDSGSGVEVDTSYDALGHTNCVSNPYSESASTSGNTCYAYDVFSRVVGVLYPDGSTQTNVYSGNTVTTTDPAGNQTSQKTDALGRLIHVAEPNSANTYYAYDALGDLTCAAQDGGSGGTFTSCSAAPASWRPRSFAYDSLSRLVTAANPETGTVCYGTWNSGTCSGGYDGNGNLQYKTDARGVVTKYSYDNLNRLLSKTYPNAPAGTLSSCYQYDAATNGMGYLGTEWTQSGACVSPPSAYQSLRAYGAYDAMGRAVSEQQCVMGYCTSASLPAQAPANCTSLSSANGLQYCYDLAGNLLAYSNGLTTAVAGQYGQHALLLSQTFDAVGRLNTVTSSWSDTTHPQELFSSLAYTPFNSLSGWLLGGQISTSRTYDTRFRATCQWSFTVNQAPSSTCQ